MKLFVKSSKENRVKKTVEMAISQFPKELINNLNIEEDIRLHHYFCGYLEDINKEFTASGKKDTKRVADFLQGKCNIKPLNIALPYLKKIYQIFTIYDKRYKGKNIILKSFRHGEKGSDGQLTENGKEQAKKMGKNISKELENLEYDFVHLLGTHNMINESIISVLFGKENFTKPELEQLGFTEQVEYIFHENEGESELEINFRNKKRTISYINFQKRIKELEIQKNNQTL